MTLVDRVIERAGALTTDEAADLYQAYAARILIQGWETESRALAKARRTARVAGIVPEYEQARHAAVTAWRHALPEVQGPWLLVGRTISNAAGAALLQGILDAHAYGVLMGPWRQALGQLVPVGPGTGARLATAGRS
ncbi:MAG: hypothetical protein ACRDGH_09335 [Candidatus Limnocylindria bacterium]